MHEQLAEYVAEMKRRGHSVEKIREVMLQHYPEKVVSDVLSEYGEVSDVPKYHDTPEKINFFEKLIGIMFSPKSFFLRVDKEDMVDSVKMYGLFMLIFVLLFGLIMVIGLSIFGRAIPGMFYLILAALVYICSIFVWSLLIPFAFVGYYYILLKLFFRMESGFDRCYTAIVYSLIQFILFGLIMLPLGLVLFFISKLFAAVTLSLLVLGIVVYNLYTQIVALSNVAKVEVFAAAVVVLLPIILGLVVSVIMYVFVKHAGPGLFTSSLANALPLSLS